MQPEESAVVQRAVAISVVMPVYNGETFLRQAVLSILNQTVRDIELILINDGSSDATAAIAQELCAADPRIRYFTQENRGVIATLNRGLELSRGEFIARMDADDVAHPRRFEKQLALLRSKPDVVICGSEAILFGDTTGRLRKPASDAQCRAWQLLGPCFIHPTVMFRRNLVDGGIRYRTEYRHAEDYDFWFQVAALGKMENIREPLLSYRVHGGQVTRTRRLAQTAMHADIAAAHLLEAGVSVDRNSLHAILFPELSHVSRWAILLSACSLFARMLARGKTTPRLMLGTACHIALHRRTGVQAGAAC